MTVPVPRAPREKPRSGFGRTISTPGALSRANLDIEILIGGADAGITDAGHGQNRHIGWMKFK